MNIFSKWSLFPFHLHQGHIFLDISDNAAAGRLHSLPHRVFDGLGVRRAVRHDDRLRDADEGRSADLDRVELRLEIADKNYGKMLSGFEYKGQRLTNFEMESAMLQGLAKLMGHKAVTVCSIIAGRVSHTSNPNYKGSIGELIQLVLNKL